MEVRYQWRFVEGTELVLPQPTQSMLADQFCSDLPEKVCLRNTEDHYYDQTWAHQHEAILAWEAYRREFWDNIPPAVLLAVYYPK